MLESEAEGANHQTSTCWMLLRMDRLAFVHTCWISAFKSSAISADTALAASLASLLCCSAQQQPRHGENRVEGRLHLRARPASWP